MNLGGKSSPLQVELYKKKWSRTCRFRSWDGWSHVQKWRNATTLVTRFPLINCHHCGKSPCFMGTLTISMGIVHRYMWSSQRLLQVLPLLHWNALAIPKLGNGRRNPAPPKDGEETLWISWYKPPSSTGDSDFATIYSSIWKLADK